MIYRGMISFDLIRKRLIKVKDKIIYMTFSLTFIGVWEYENAYSESKKMKISQLE